MPEFKPQTIHDYRNALGKTQADLGREIGRSDGTVLRYEQGRRVPSARMIGLLADALDVAVTAFYA